MPKLYKKFSLISPLIWLLILLFISFLLRINQLSKPSIYIFDEVYHVVTARAYSQNNPEAYNPYSSPPEPDTAFDWLHPPLAKLIQAGSIKLIGDSSFAWRFPSAIFGTLSIAALYYFCLTLFKNHKLALLAATLFSLDGLQLTMSRITMNDIFVTTFIIFSLNFFFKALTKTPLLVNKKYLFLTGLFTGLALATKWSALFLYPIFSIFIAPKLIFELIQKKDFIKVFKQFFYCFTFLLVLPLTIYFLSYTQYFLMGYTLKSFISLHQQIFGYQTNLTATHGYQSFAWQWPLLIKPVWFYVKYSTNHIANIYNLGNPAIFWGGLIAVTYQIIQFIKRLSLANLKKSLFKVSSLHFMLVSYILLFLPWISSPRILFFHHYLPALPFICLIIAQTIHKQKSLVTAYLFLAIVLFLFFYPLNTAIPLPSNLVSFWFWLPSWK